MPLTWPAEPEFVNHSERKVWNALREQLGEDDLLIANQRFTNRGRDFELDIAVVFQDAGVVVVEVKGGKVWAEGGQWWQADNAGGHKIWPVKQASENKFILREWVESSMPWAGKQRIRWAHAVAFPGIEVDPGFDTPDLHRWMVIDRNDLPNIADKLRNIPLTQDTQYRVPDGADAFAIHQALQGRFLPQKGALLSPEAQVADHDEVAERLSAEQGRLLDAMALLNRVEVRGGAGTGKTWLAVEQARRLAASGKRVALVSYSRGLASWLERRVATFPDAEQPAYVGTFHGLGRPWGAPDGSDDDSSFWEVELPALMVDLARAQPLENLYDAIVIDEAQDFADLWWPAIHAALKYEDDALFVFSDEGQRIFSRFGAPPSDLVPIVLDRNLRNTKPISEAFLQMAPSRLFASDYDGPAVRFVACSADDAVSRADDIVDELLDEGWQPSDVALLTTQSRHPEQLNRQADGHDAYWDSFWDDDQVFYGTVLGFKGLERPTVVLAVNDVHFDRARERLYTGLSRPRDLLVVCGDPEHIRRVGGDEVLERIGG